jgi:hypothetical protein
MTNQPPVSGHLHSSRQRGDRSVRRRNLVVLAILVGFVTFGFVLSFSHVALEAGGSARKTQH